MHIISDMVKPIEKVKEFFRMIPPDSQSIKIFAAIPIICNLFLEVKKNQLSETKEYEDLKKVTKVIKDWRAVQLLCFPFIAKYLEKMTFKQRNALLVVATVLAVTSEVHVEKVMDLAEKNL